MSGKFNKKVRYNKKFYNIYSWRGKEYKFIGTPKLKKKKDNQNLPKIQHKRKNSGFFPSIFKLFRF